MKERPAASPHSKERFAAGWVVAPLDASGSPVPQCSDPSLHEWFSHSSTPMLSPNEVAFDDKLHTVNSVFPVVPGETYTLLAACAFNHSEKSSQGMWLAVAKPMTFVAPEPYVRADRPPQKIELAGPAPARPRLKLSADEEWKVLSLRRQAFWRDAT